MEPHDDKHLLLHILDPVFLIQVLRILAQSAAQVCPDTLSCLCAVCLKTSVSRNVLQHRDSVPTICILCSAIFPQGP